MEAIKWDYLMIDMHCYSNEYVGKTMDNLRNLGKQGWEVCGVVNPDIQAGGTFSMPSGVLVKRPMLPEFGY